MNNELKFVTPTPAEIDRVIAQAHALRSAYTASIAQSAARKLSDLFRRAPHGAATA